MQDANENTLASVATQADYLFVRAPLSSLFGYRSNDDLLLPQWVKTAFIPYLNSDCVDGSTCYVEHWNLLKTEAIYLVQVILSLTEFTWRRF